MKRLFLAVLAAAGSLTGRPADEWRPSQLSAQGLRHSDIALMPEGTPEDYELFRQLRPSVVAWGEDGLAVVGGDEAARRRFAAKFAAYARLGIAHRATNVWMLTATQRFLHAHPEFLDATCVDPWGERILPRWLADADYQGVKPWWGCTNHPRYQEHLLARMRAGLAAGATMVHLDDHAGTAACAEHAGGCFCPYCLAGFRRWLGEHASRPELAAAGVPDPADFDYADHLRRQGHADRAAFLAAWHREPGPLRRWFLAFQREAAAAFVGRMQSEAARTAGHPVPFGVNAYNLLPAQLFDARQIDYFANEVEHVGQEDLIAPVVYRLGEALDRPVFATGTGEDWIAYRATNADNRVRGWIAQAYAFGQHFMYSWRKWGFSEKTGTQWTVVRPDVFSPLTDFVATHRELFDGFANAAATGLLYDNSAAAANRWGVRPASRALLDAGVPFGLVVAGDALLARPLTATDLAAFRTLVVPADIKLTDQQRELLNAWEQRGGKIVPDQGPPLAGLPGRIKVQAAGRVWALPRVHPGAGSSAPAMVVHLLNRDYDAATDAMKSILRLRLSFVPAEIGGPTRPAKARYYRPGADPVDLALAMDADGEVTLELPGLELWGIVAFD